jgi:chloramphenicol 3-O-phosphotransferase
MRLVILNGPTGTGKNTVSEIVARRRDRCAVIDYDDLRNQFRTPHLTPWDGEAANGYDCIILDVLDDESASLYRELLAGHDPVLVHLLPTWEEIVRRNGTRPPRLTDAELRIVYEGQERLSVYDRRIDTTDMSPEETASRVLELMD